ncbi:MAG: hypothetical protein ACQCN3_12490 [Candidatus Bathyarchaeia archaeon]
MVKIQVRTIPKKYMDKVYRYTQHVIALPLNCNAELEPFLNKQLELSVKDDALVLTIKKPMEAAQDGERN